MSLRETLQSILKKKEGLMGELQGARKELAEFRPRPVQTYVHNRVRRLRNSVARRRKGQKAIMNEFKGC